MSSPLRRTWRYLSNLLPTKLTKDVSCCAISRPQHRRSKPLPVPTDSVMLTALMCFYISGIIDINKTLKGFNSQGLLTVLVLFVVAEGLNKTGALNWYVGKLFGRPTTLAGAQLRIMIPITLLSGFINDTPLVTIALPIVIQWAKKINLSTRFVLMPLSFAALLGGVSSSAQPGISFHQKPFDFVIHYSFGGYS